MIDAVQMYAYALDRYFDGLDDFETKAQNCQGKLTTADNSWPAGESIYNQFSAVSILIVSINSTLRAHSHTWLLK